MPEVTRPIWKGQLRLSLVSIPVEMFTATKSGAKPSFRQIHEPTGKPIRYEKVVEGHGVVNPDDIRKGFEYEKGDYVLLTDDEIDAVKLETRKTLELVQFVDEDEIPAIYYDAPYFVAPADELAEDAFRVVRDALRKAKKIGLGQLAMRGKEYLVAVKPFDKGILLETLHYADELRKPEAYFSDISAEATDADLLDVATALIEKKTTKFDAKLFEDHYQSALRELIARKLKSKDRKVATEVEEPGSAPQTSNVVDLMAMLKKSLETGESRNAATKARISASRKAPAAKAAAKPAARKKAS